MNSEMLIQWYKKHNIEDRTINGFWTYLDNWRNEDSDFEFEFGDLDKRLIELEVKKIQFTHIFNYNDFIYVLLWIYYNDENIGSYKSVYTLDGESEDDILNFDDNRFIKILVETTNNSIEIAEKALMEGISSEVVGKISGLKSSLIADIKSKVS
ncbi:hypothetical protein BED47_03930 [Gottfriedia luciferensis]|uniref:Uncharacterized protein n=1 Tax=Gottfriedia luciferensis TaxID=178774 RepID=A0ABX2ZXS1_9BACI|nr:hypothetical protein [Gottfriedia luciferensis]ODG93445.1 hypothetical protein BED47_03930 [Gottfriedia luciferensis]